MEAIVILKEKIIMKYIENISQLGICAQAHIKGQTNCIFPWLTNDTFVSRKFWRKAM